MRESVIYQSINRMWRLSFATNMEGRELYVLEHRKGYKNDYPMPMTDGRIIYLNPTRVPHFIKRDVRKVIGRRNAEKRAVRLG